MISCLSRIFLRSFLLIIVHPFGSSGYNVISASIIVSKLNSTFVSLSLVQCKNLKPALAGTSGNATVLPSVTSTTSTEDPWKLGLKVTS